MIKQNSAGIIVFREKKHNNEYLLLHYESGHWDFPKGKIETGETELEAAKRELNEEAGIEAEIYDGFKKKIEYMFTNSSGELVSKSVVFFVGKAKTDNIKLSFEHIGYKWLPFDDAIKQLTYKTAREILEKANSFIEKSTL